MSVVAFPIFKFVPGHCRACGARPRVRGQWVACTDPLCHMSRHPTTVQCWPRRRVVDVLPTALAAFRWFALFFALTFAIGAAWALLGVLTP